MMTETAAADGAGRAAFISPLEINREEEATTTFNNNSVITKTTIISDKYDN